ncbi:hypothetical protein [Komagataeibacter sp. FNDCF1]|uniref:VpaChn25_0724 family phage protein n=1 Tax=Komagataeibacter sp. FNDCF1 TaxID=2878681 RepID=UPI001E3206B2|nr:hypothetical protein [Komagataeibacter sp. FNDCF1]MCE2563759.1 hypothetical protein [Komagataeibacter sp. FNDCF1]MCE2566183.1 hypothetical protein [Komagataeibacter sp. FNDCF1]
MSAAEALIEDRRLRILKSLEEMQDRRLNEDVLVRMIAASGQSIDIDTLRADLTFLQHQGCVAIEKLPRMHGDLWVVNMTDKGARVASGVQRLHGVARNLMF